MPLQVDQLGWHQYDFLLFGVLLMIAFIAALLCLVRAAFSSHFGNPFNVSISAIFIALAVYTAIRCVRIRAETALPAPQWHGTRA